MKVPLLFSETELFSIHVLLVFSIRLDLTCHYSRAILPYVWSSVPCNLLSCSNFQDGLSRVTEQSGVGFVCRLRDNLLGFDTLLWCTHWLV